MIPLKDNEFLQWSPTYPDLGGNPSGNLPAEGTIEYQADNPKITKLTYKSPDGGESPDLSEDGRQGIYVRSGTVGSGRVTATPVGMPSSFRQEEETFDVQSTEAGTLGMTVGFPKGESVPGGDPDETLPPGGTTMARTPNVARANEVGGGNPPRRAGETDAQYQARTARRG